MITKYKIFLVLFLNIVLDYANCIHENYSLFYKEKCPSESIYPYAMPLIMTIYSNEYDKFGNEITGSIKGVSCFEQFDYFNLIYTISNTTMNTLPNILIEQNFLSRYVYINFRGEILAFNQVPIFIDYNLLNENYKITINIKKDIKLINNNKN